MDASKTLGSFDHITDDDLKAMAAAAGPVVSLFAPTAPAHHQPQDTGTRIKSLTTTAARALVEQGTDEATAKRIVAPLEQLATDGTFLRNQSQSLAAFAADGVHFVYRLGLSLEEQVAVNDHFVLRPIAPALTSSHAFYVLGLSRNKVRLFNATEDSIHPVELGDTVPASIDEVVDPEERQKQLQHRSTGGGKAMFHGHGSGDEIDQIDKEKFVKAVGDGLGTLLGKARSQPMVLASVAEAHPLMKRLSAYPVLLDDFIPGNPDATNPTDLHAAAWGIVRSWFEKNDDAAFDRFAAAHGTGNGIAQPEQVREAAQQGRVDTLFINPAPEQSGADTGSGSDEGDVDRAILHTLNSSGTLVVISDGRVEDVGALLRF
ncbi:MAG: baeRF3 domain-containing protein [Micrococcaceae bacterium]